MLTCTVHGKFPHVYTFLTTVETIPPRLLPQAFIEYFKKGCPKCAYKNALKRTIYKATYEHIPT